MAHIQQTLIYIYTCPYIVVQFPLICIYILPQPVCGQTILDCCRELLFPPPPPRCCTVLGWPWNGLIL
ncbi:hypothetical protein XELAEV_18028170mg [Xenopus laevis]|uniref:Uncharacterized protein n=1 Tax=Xenopus laevis TaxID=8355 RepID=A0A974CYY8_XENLA|nr:hypothetical protein XELAEV_18028170mg [Xenopus laevis]